MQLDDIREYSKRYQKIHRSESVLLWLNMNRPNLPKIGLTKDVGLAMPDQFKDYNAKDCNAKGNAMKTTSVTPATNNQTK